MKYDLIVVGAGVLGVFHAYHAAKMGKQVLILEKDEKPVGSTIQNFGQIVPSGLAGEWLSYARRSLDIYKDLQLKANLTVTQNGSLYIASDEDEQLLLEELHTLHQEKKHESILLTKKSALTRVPSLNPEYARLALFYPQEVSVNPREMIYKLIAYIQEKYQVKYSANSEVVSIENLGAEVKVDTINTKNYLAEAVLVCSGFHANKLFPNFLNNAGLVVSKLQMMRTAPLPRLQLKPNILTGLTIRRYESFTECPSFRNIQVPERLKAFIEKGIHILFKQESDGRIIIGDSHEYAPLAEMDKLGKLNDKEIDELIISEARNIVNHDFLEIEHRWSGFYVQHKNDIVAEYIEPNVKIITGIGGKGMTSSAGYSEESIINFYNL